MVFLPASLTEMTNRFVRNSDGPRPVFKRDIPHVALGGSILRYSTTGPARRASAAPAGYKAVPVPGGFKWVRA